MPPAPVELAASSLRLRPWQPGHADALCEAAQESVATVGRWLPWCHAGYAWEDAVAWIEHCQGGWLRGDPYAFAIFDAADRLVGGAGLNRLDREHRSANLGYWIRQQAQGKGMAPIAVQAVAAFGFATLSLSRIEIVVAVDNAASRRCAEKAGARFEGIARQRLVVDAVPVDAAIYGLLPADQA
ncbi:GNAT family N-acetyltransferase [Dyella soli]|uniref:N-acetyltransferase n=1 Tax=Dyella soli TaxID=522319 RepID=A0A4R0YMD3_9GAMM|nr:GNAT family N-acetyltransferase [Dyella soli]TCI10039.1 N-acetyltransferase [Dyella soli]